MLLSDADTDTFHNKFIDEDIAQALRMLSIHSDIAVRQHFGRYVLQALHQPIDRILSDLSTIIATIGVISEDKEAAVRSSLLADIPDIVNKSLELSIDNVDSLLYDRLLEIMLQYLEDVDPQLRKNAFYAVKHLLEISILDEKRILEKVCPAITGISNVSLRNHDVDYYTNAIELMAQLASIIGQENTEKHLLDHFCRMCGDVVYSIRRWCADYMPVFCYVLGQKITEDKLLGIFQLLCEDSVWGVRKSAAKSLPKVALMCSLQNRRSILAPIAFKLLNDPSRFVSGSAFKNLGQLITTFAQPCVVQLEYASSGKMYISSKSQSDTRSDNNSRCCNVEQNVLPKQRISDFSTELDSIDQNPFKMFLSNESLTAIQSINPTELINLNIQTLLRINKQAADLDGTNHTTKSKLSNDNEDDDEINSSSGCSSASSTDGCDNEDVETETLTETKNCDSSTNEKCDLIQEKSYTDEFYDSFPNDLLAKLPDGLREVIAEIRETTHADIRQRLKTSSLKLLRDKDEFRIRKNIGMLRLKITSKKTAGGDGPNNENKGTFNTLTPSFTSQLTAKESNSNTVIIDDTKVTLRRKLSNEGLGKLLSTDTQSTNSNEHEAEDDELKEFNSLNYWYISPNINIENELKTLEQKKIDISKVSCKENAVTNEEQSTDLDGLCVFWGMNFEISPANDGNDNVHKRKLDELKANCVGPSQDPTASLCNQPIVPPYLIEYFVSMEHFADSDLNLYCVYNFPAVVLTLKKEHWHLMYELLLYLANDIQWKVRKTIAMFICDIALIIGRENTHRDLMPIFLAFFKDLDEVKIEALKNLPTFLSVIDVKEHPKVIVNLSECLQCDSDSNWRFREELARQLLYLIKTYGHVYSIAHMIFVTGLAITLLNDKVSAVRSVAMDAIAEKFCNSTAVEFKYLAELLVEDFGCNVHWRRRQMFINICQELIAKKNSPPIDIIENNFLPHILKLARDKIPNIRLAVVKLLSLFIVQYFPTKSLRGLLTDQLPIIQTIVLLQSDVDIDVNFVANNSFLM